MAWGVRDHLAAEKSMFSRAGVKTGTVESPNDLLLRAGTRFVNVPDVSETGIEHGVPGYCFSNVLSFVSEMHERGETGWRYYEGKATKSGLPWPLSHAWAVNVDTGDVVDLTWYEDCENGGVGDEYLGVEVPMSVVEWLADKRDICGVLENWWMLPKTLVKRLFSHATRKVDAPKV